MAVIYKSKLSEHSKKKKCKEVIMDFFKSGPPGFRFDPAEFEKYLEHIGEVTLLICQKNIPVDSYVTDLHICIQCLGTTRDQVMKQGEFILENLRRDMVFGRDIESVGMSAGKEKFNVSHYGMRKLARWISTPEANIQFEIMSASLDMVKDSIALSHSFLQDRAVNLGEHKLITDMLKNFEFESSGSGSNMLLNIERKMLHICFGVGKASLIQVCGIDGEIRDASAKQKFITFSNAVRDVLKRKLLNVAQAATAASKVIPKQEEQKIFDEIIEFIQLYIRDWGTIEERIRDFLVVIMLDHRDEVELRSGKKLKRPLEVSSRQVRALRP